MISAKFYQFDKETSEKIITNCRLNKLTVQGVLCVAVMNGLLSSQKHDFSTSNKFISLVPCNMRASISDSLTNDDLLCASAGLTVIQDVSSDSTLMSLASDVSLNLKKLIDKKEGIKWWTKLKNSIPIQPYSIMSSSIGNISLEESLLKNIKINDVRFMGGASSVPENTASVMTHIFTFNGRLTLTFCFTYPVLSENFADEFVKHELDVFKFFSSNSNKETTLNDFIKK